MSMEDDAYETMTFLRKNISGLQPDKRKPENVYIKLYDGREIPVDTEYAGYDGHTHQWNAQIPAHFVDDIMRLGIAVLPAYTTIRAALHNPES